MRQAPQRILERAAKWPAKRRHWYVDRGLAFDESNDHNPLVSEECPRCHGRGAHDEWGEDEHGHFQALVGCSACKGTGTTGERVRYFDNDSPVAEVAVRAGGWITCPCCKWSFMVTDRDVWTGLRHVRCGQRIRPLGGDA